jgi:hypothetical protein
LRTRRDTGSVALVKKIPIYALLVSLVPFACDNSSAQKPATADDKAKAEDDDYDARMKKRAEAREAKRVAEEEAQQAVVAKIEEITVIPEGTKLPKKPAEACTQVVEAQRGFMKKFHAEVPEDALTTQLGMLAKQCNEMGSIEVSMCQKFALDATTEQLKSQINEYLPVCMRKYGKG